MAEHITENCERLADIIIDQMDPKDCMRILYDIYVEQFQSDKEYFDQCWTDYGIDET